MKRAAAQRLMQLFDNNYLVMIDDHSYVDSPAQSVNHLQEDDDEYDATIPDDEQDIVYSSETFTNRSLGDIPITNVKVYKPINFETEEIVYNDLEELKHEY